MLCDEKYQRIFFVFQSVWFGYDVETFENSFPFIPLIEDEFLFTLYLLFVQEQQQEKSEANNKNAIDTIEKIARNKVKPYRSWNDSICKKIQSDSEFFFVGNYSTVGVNKQSLERKKGDFKGMMPIMILFVFNASKPYHPLFSSFPMFHR